MGTKVYWGLGVLLVLLIGVFVLVMVNEYAENQQLEDEAKKAQEQADRSKQQKNVKDNTLKMPIDNPTGPIEHHDVPIADVKNIEKQPTSETYAGSLTYHEELLKTNPVKALRLQSEERGHWSAKWIPPFPSDDTEAAEIAKAVYIWIDYYIIKGYSDKDPRPPEITHAEHVVSDFDKKFWETFDPAQRADPRTCDLLKLVWARRNQPVNRAFIWPSTFDK